jgi:riboflavin biosynthesis pyrimidine reductase
MVSSLDGVATVQGFSEGLSGLPDKRVFGILRALADVVVVGAGTARAENYRGARVAERFAAMRGPAGQLPQPSIALVSRSLGLDPEARVFTETKVRPIVITCAAASPERRRSLAEVADVIDAGENAVDLTAARAALEERGFKRILCEGGPTLLHGLLEADVVDELCLTWSPQLVGGPAARVTNLPTWFAPPRALSLLHLLHADGVLLGRWQVARLGA